MKKKRVAQNQLLVSILAYFLVGIIWYFLDENVQGSLAHFHVKQALNVFVISVGLGLLHSILGILTFGILLVLLAPAFALLQFVLFIFWIIGIVFAAQEKEEEIPIIGNFANKYLFF